MRRSIAVLALAFMAPAAAHAETADFISFGMSSNVQVNDVNCGYEPGGCLVRESGVAFLPGTGLSNYQGAFSMNWYGNSTSNGKGGYCTPSSGTTTVVASDGSGEMDLFEIGQICDQGASSTSLPHVFKGSFSIVSGTGSYESASGSGSVESVDNGSNESWFVAQGQISLPSLASWQSFSLPGLFQANAASVVPVSEIVAPKTHVDFNGRDFGHEEDVAVTLAGQAISKAHADGGGNFSTGSIAAPDLPGDYEYSFSGQQSGITRTARITVR